MKRLHPIHHLAAPILALLAAQAGAQGADPFINIPQRDPAPLVQAIGLNEAGFAALLAEGGGTRFAQLVAPYDLPDGAIQPEPHWLAGPRYSCNELQTPSACRQYLVALLVIQRHKQARPDAPGAR